MHVVTDRIGGTDDIDSEINFLTRNGAYASTYGTMLKLGKGATVSGFVQFGSYTTTERNALTPANGMVIYNTTVNKFQAYENSAWIDITSLDGSHTGTFDGDVTGSVFGDDSTVLVDGVNNTLHGVVLGGMQEIVGPGVVNLTTTSTEIVTTGTDAYTLANGTYGQIKHIIKIGGAGAATITPASFANGTSVELASDFNCVSLLYTNSGWAVIAAQNITINA
jgi:hypothetical protein